jgi:cysteine desulfurase
MPKSNRTRGNKTEKIKSIYLDYASSSVLEEANPSSIHDLGFREKDKLEKARSEVALFLGAHGYETIFTSGSTESNNLAILGLMHLTPSPLSLPRRGVGERWIPHIITTNIEHASVIEVFKHLRDTKQAEVSFVEVESNGIVDPKKIRKNFKSNTVLVSVMYANNEIGTIQPVSEIAKEIRHHNKTNLNKIFFHTDATQAVNYLPISVEKLGVDLLSFNGAKIYGPKGIGVLYVKKSTPLKKIMFGGDQEMGFRPGTENVSSALALAKALSWVKKNKEKETKRLSVLRDYFIKKILALGKKSGREIILNGDLKHRLPNNINITILGIPSDLLVIELSAKGIMTAGKSACKSGDGKISHVIKAINKNIKDTDGAIRFSLGRDTTKREIDYTLKSLSHILQKLEKWYN